MSTRARPDAHLSLAAPVANPQKKASPAGSSVTAKGKSQANFSASTRNASPTQNRPNAKYPQPNHHPAANARAKALRRQGRAASGAACDPSMSQTRTGRVTNNTGHKNSGGMARTERLP